MHDHEYIADAIKRGLVQSLDRLLDDPDVTVRLKATECLFVMSRMHPNFASAWVSYIYWTVCTAFKYDIYTNVQYCIITVLNAV